MKKSKKFLSLLLSGLIFSSTIIPVTVNASEKDTNNGSDISVYHFYQYPDDPDTGGHWASGYWAQEGVSYIPLWEYNPDKTNIADGLVSTNYFRTAKDEVAYCLNYGKLVPSDTVYPDTETSTEVQRVIAKGYPSMKGSDYGISDIELEWATGVALNIVEGNGYNTEGNIVPGTEIKLEYFYNDVFNYTYSKENYPNIPDNVLSDYTQKANKVRDVVVDLVAAASDDSIEFNYLTIDANNASMTDNATNLDENVKYGPFVINTNRSNAKISFDGALPKDMYFTDSDGTKLDDVPLNKEFYINGVAKEELSFSMKAYDETGIYYPTHLYANDNVSEQSMYIVKSLPLKDEVEMFANYNAITLTDVTIVKKDSNTGESLPGAVFEVYNDSNELIHTVTTGEDGSIVIKELIPGRYSIKEVSSPVGYITNKEPIIFSIDENGVVNDFDNNTITVNNAPTKVVLSKTDITSSEPVSGAEITIRDASNNVVFTDITAEDGTIVINALPVGTYTFTETVAPDGYVISDETYSFTINDDGTVIGSTSFTNKPTEVIISKTDFTTAEPVANAEITIKNSDGKIVFSDKTDKYGQVKATYLPAGVYTFEETQVPSGYEKLTQTFTFEIKKDGSVVGDTNITNKPTKVTLFKFDSNTLAGLAGAEFKVINKETNKEYICVSDSDGYCSISYLPVGEYYWFETKAPNGYALSGKGYSFEILEDGTISGTTKMGNSQTEVVITKYDITDSSPLPGAEITIIDPDTNEVIFKDVTDKDGTVKAVSLIPGTYIFKETAAPKGYITSSETLTFTLKEDGSITGDTAIYNTPTKVVIQKKDEKTGDFLAGAKITVNDSKGNAVYTGVTDENGLLTITGLSVGKYTYSEVEAPSGYILSNKKYPFEIKEDGTVIGELVLYNYSPSVSILKLDANTNKPLSGAVIVVKNRAGEVVYTGETDENGLITITGLPVGVYTYTEIKAPSGYIVSTRTYTFIVDANGKVSGDTEITNTATRVVITKKDITNGKVLAGATIEVKDANNTTVYKGVTDKNGQIVIVGLPIGTYTFSETVAPEGYELNTETLKFVITEDGSISGDVEIFDTPATQDDPEKPSDPEDPDTPDDGDPDIPTDETETDQNTVQTGQSNFTAIISLIALISFVILLSAYYKKKSELN